MKWFEYIIIVVAIGLFLLPFILQIIKKKKGKPSCSCGCSECSRCDCCSKKLMK
ncbi:MAG: FeoB-associated Cys-rich membrane protein [Bacilli bacterium]|nr:FeoB-associated Cys-rich membrane protein [Acholeplasmataceae bacterium]MDY2902493.1 FeoB-associated Cys-rich membrane protein [Bacilli bacterium]